MIAVLLGMKLAFLLSNATFTDTQALLFVIVYAKLTLILYLSASFGENCYEILLFFINLNTKNRSACRGVVTTLPQELSS